MKKGFERLLAWQEAKALAVALYRQCAKPPLCADWGLRDQMQRAAISISSNIAEGFERDSTKDELRLLGIAMGSASELRSQLLVISEIGIVDKDACESLVSQCHRVSRLVFNLMKHKRAELAARGR